MSEGVVKPSVSRLPKAAILILALCPVVPAAPESSSRVLLPNRAVSMRVKGLGLLDALKALGGEDGRLTAVKHLADRRVTLFLGGESSRSALEAFCELWSTKRYPVEWRKLRDGRLQLWQDPAAAVELERILNADRKAIDAALDSLQSVVDVEKPELRERTQNPIVREALYPGNWPDNGRGVIGYYGSFSKNERAAILSGVGTWKPFAALSPQDQAGLTRGSMGKERRVFPQANGAPQRETDEEAFRRFSGSQYGLSLAFDENGKWHLWASIRHPDRPGTSTGYGIPLGQLGVSQPASDWSISADAAGKTYSGRPAAALDSGPWRELADFQLGLGEHLRIPVISDYYHDKAPPARGLISSAEKWEAALTKVCEASRYEWRRQPTNGLLFRNRRWYLDDTREFPATLEKELRQSMDRRGYLDLPQLCRVAQLTTVQIGRIERWFPEADTLATVSPLLRWYAALPARLRQQATETGLLIAQSGKESIKHLLASDGRPLPLVSQTGDPGRGVARVSLVPHDGGAIATFGIHEGRAGVQFRLVMGTGDAPRSLGKTPLQDRSP